MRYRASLSLDWPWRRAPAFLLPTSRRTIRSAPVIALAILAVAALLSRNSFAVYALVATGFFFLHSLSTSDSPALHLARELGEKPRPVSVLGSVVSEPKISPNGSASFLLQAESIEIDGETRPCNARFFARWRHAVEFGDEVKLFGTAERLGRATKSRRV